jgi:hypothetical protein
VTVLSKSLLRSALEETHTIILSEEASATVEEKEKKNTIGGDPGGKRISGEKPLGKEHPKIYLQASGEEMLPCMLVCVATLPCHETCPSRTKRLQPKDLRPESEAMKREDDHEL